MSVVTLILLGALYWGHLFRKQALAFYALAERLPDSQAALRNQAHRNAAGASFVDIVLISYAIAIMSYAPAWQHLTPWILCLVPVIWIHYRMATRYARIDTPYWNIEDASSQNIVFISYKSQDSELVRAVAEHLMASGQLVWLDQYAIPLLARTDFRERYIAGITRCSVFLVFLHQDYYAESPYCKEELDAIEAKARNSSSLILTIVTSEQSSESEADKRLRVIEKARIAASSRIEVATFLSEHGLGGPIIDGERNAIEKDTTLVETHGDSIIQLDHSGWKNTRRRRISLMKDPLDFVGVQLQRRFSTGGCATVEWTLGPDAGRIERIRRFEHATGINDKDFIKWLVDFAISYVKRNPEFSCIGTHAVFIDGFGHLALTYWNVHTWARMYSVMLPHPTQPKLNWELHMRIGFKGTFEQLCQAASEMDTLIKSFQWRRSE